MRKYNEGYTLPFVLVVFLVTSLVAVSILTVSIHNLHGQKASVDRMEAQYAAQGEIEKVTAILRDAVQSDGKLNISAGKLTSDYAPHAENTDFTLEKVTFENGKQGLELRAVTTKGTLRVAAVFRITGEHIQEDVDQEYTSYTVTDVVIKIDAYTVDTIEPTSEESAGGV